MKALPAPVLVCTSVVCSKHCKWPSEHRQAAPFAEVLQKLCDDFMFRSIAGRCCNKLEAWKV